MTDSSLSIQESPSVISLIKLDCSKLQKITLTHERHSYGCQTVAYSASRKSSHDIFSENEIYTQGSDPLALDGPQECQGRASIYLPDAHEEDEQETPLTPRAPQRMISMKIIENGKHQENDILLIPHATAHSPQKLSPSLSASLCDEPPSLPEQSPLSSDAESEASFNIDDTVILNSYSTQHHPILSSDADFPPEILKDLMKVQTLASTVNQFCDSMKMHCQDQQTKSSSPLWISKLLHYIKKTICYLTRELMYREYYQHPITQADREHIVTICKNTLSIIDNMQAEFNELLKYCQNDVDIYGEDFLGQCQLLILNQYIVDIETQYYSFANNVKTYLKCPPLNLDHQPNILSEHYEIALNQTIAAKFTHPHRNSEAVLHTLDCLDSTLRDWSNTKVNI